MTEFSFSKRVDASPRISKRDPDEARGKSTFCSSCSYCEERINPRYGNVWLWCTSSNQWCRYANQGCWRREEQDYD